MRAVAVVLLFALLSALAFATVHLSHKYDTSHDATHCALCVFQSSIGSTELPSIGLVVSVILIAVVVLRFHVQRIAQIVLLAANAVRAPPLL